MNNKILDKILNKYSIKEQDISCIEHVGGKKMAWLMKYGGTENSLQMLR